MGENRSLDEFVPAGADASGAATDEGDGTGEKERATDEGTATGDRATSAGVTEGDDVTETDGATETDGDERVADGKRVADDETMGEAADPATVTYRWDPDGGVCARCEATVERRWRDDGAFVCGDCKEW